MKNYGLKSEENNKEEQKTGEKGYQVSKVIYTVGENTLSLFLQLHTFRFLIGLNAVMQNVNWKTHILGVGVHACACAGGWVWVDKAKTCINIFI